MHTPSSVKDAILLVAGMGSRLRPLTETRPKCLLEVGGEPLLLRLLRQLRELGIEHVVLATGYLPETIAAAVGGRPGLPRISFAHNPNFDSTNNAHSLLVALEHVEGRPFLLCDGDVLLGDTSWLGALARDARENVLSVLARDDMGEEEMKVVLDETGAVVGLSKGLDPAKSYGESLGLQKIGARIGADLRARLEAMTDAERARLYYEDVFAELIDRGHPFHVLDAVAGTWTEIDTVEDLEHARALYAGWDA